MVLDQNAKKYHWLRTASYSVTFTCRFDEHATEILETVDECAERTLTFDVKPLADPADCIPNASVHPSKGRLRLKAMIEEAVSNY